MLLTTETKIRARIRGKGRGKVHTNKDFLDLASRCSVDRTLSDMADRGELQRVQRGIYLYPRCNKRLGITLSASPDDIVAAVARRTGNRVEPSGAVAANLLGLTTQVPAKLVFYTDGLSKRVRVGKQEIVLKHTSSKTLPCGTKISCLVVLALHHLGRDAVDNTVIQKLRSVLQDADKRHLQQDVRYQTDWIRDAVGKIVAPNE